VAPADVAIAIDEDDIAIRLQCREINGCKALHNVGGIRRDAQPVQGGRQYIERRRPIRHDDGAAAAEILEQPRLGHDTSLSEGTAAASNREELCTRYGSG
jgi:hypothetical protein